MATIGRLATLALVLGCAVVALSPKRRARMARKLALARNFLSRRVVDRDAREQTDQARWADDGGPSRTPAAPLA